MEIPVPRLQTDHPVIYDTSKFSPVVELPWEEEDRKRYEELKGPEDAPDADRTILNPEFVVPGVYEPFLFPAPKKMRISDATVAFRGTPLNSWRTMGAYALDFWHNCVLPTMQATYDSVRMGVTNRADVADAVRRYSADMLVYRDCLEGTMMHQKYIPGFEVQWSALTNVLDDADTEVSFCDLWIVLSLGWCYHQMLALVVERPDDSLYRTVAKMAMFHMMCRILIHLYE